MCTFLWSKIAYRTIRVPSNLLYEQMSFADFQLARRVQGVLSQGHLQLPSKLLCRLSVLAGNILLGCYSSICDILLQDGVLVIGVDCVLA